MKSIVAWALVIGMAGVAAASEPTSSPETNTSTPPQYERIFIPVDDSVADIVPYLDASPDGVAPHAPPSRLIYLNNCKPNGCAIKPGREDSRSNSSSIVRGSTTRTLAAFSGSDASWNAIVQCVRETYAPFNVTITTDDPCPNADGSCTTPHWEAMSAGLPTQVGMSNGVAGVAPYSCGVISNAITFSFINLYPSDVNEACWTIAQETAHAFGLAHEMLGADPMTYIQAPARKRFQDQTACIGTQGCCAPSQECQCGPTEQNSYQKLMSIFGTSMPTPPTVAITNPTNNATVDPGFIINATATDANGVQRVDLLIDGTLTATLTVPPFAFNAPASVGPGSHTVAIKATDTLGGEGTAQISVTVRAEDPCDGDNDCADEGDSLVCVDGRCVPGPDLESGLGAACADPSDCASGLCVNGPDGALCAEECDPSANACPNGFSCASSGANPNEGFCYPGGGSGGVEGGCCSTGSDNNPLVAIGLGAVVAGLLTRRRRRA